VAVPAPFLCHKERRGKESRVKTRFKHFRNNVILGAKYGTRKKRKRYDNYTRTTGNKHIEVALNTLNLASLGGWRARKSQGMLAKVLGVGRAFFWLGGSSLGVGSGVGWSRRRASGRVLVAPGWRRVRVLGLFVPSLSPMCPTAFSLPPADVTPRQSIITRKPIGTIALYSLSLLDTRNIRKALILSVGVEGDGLTEAKQPPRMQALFLYSPAIVI
jgi:hypothetical protein